MYALTCEFQVMMRCLYMLLLFMIKPMKVLISRCNALIIAIIEPLTWHEQMEIPIYHLF